MMYTWFSIYLLINIKKKLIFEPSWKLEAKLQNKKKIHISLLLYPNLEVEILFKG